MAFVDYRDPRPVYEQIVDYYEKTDTDRGHAAG